MLVIADSKLEVREPTREFAEWAKSTLTLRNPDYDKKMRMGKWLGNTPEHIALYERIGETLVLPFGMVAPMMREFGEDIRLRSRGWCAERVEYHSAINPYPYQAKAVEAALKAGNGVVVMPCGAGKTQTALELVARLGLPCLWLTHTHDLLNQSMNRARAVLDAPVGSITGGKVNISRGITFATVQTMARLDLSYYRRCWGVVIVDECHRAIGSPTQVMQFYKVLSNLACKYKFGLTATPKRADGLERSMFALLGEVVYEVSRADVADTTCPVSVEFRDTEYTPNLDMALAGDGTLNYTGLVNDLTGDEGRFKTVLDTIAAQGSRTLVLANRVNYLSRLQKALEGRGFKTVCLSVLGASKAAKAQRNAALNALDAGEIDCVLATYQLAKEGLDVPRLEHLILATPEKDETTVMQAAGRVGRKAQGKACGHIIDFRDNFGMLKGWARKRARIYAKLGYSCL